MPRALVLLIAIGVAAAQLAATAQAASAPRTEVQLKAVRDQIERVTQQVSRDALERDRLSNSLRDAEISLGGAHAELDRLHNEYAERSARRQGLAQERQQQQSALTQGRAALAGQLRAAYVIGREEPLKLLLNQRDPLYSARLFRYYAYFGRARADQIAGIEEHVKRIDAIDADLATEQATLVDLKSAQEEQLKRLERARGDRQKVLASLEFQAHSREQSLTRLKTQQADLEKLLQELNRSLKSVPPSDTASAFGRRRGQLSWPVAGRLAHEFGDQRASGVRWDGLVVAAARGAPVTTVCSGRVVYADWLPGLGLLIIVDHGEGYLSLYGHNDRLYKAAGDQVATGDVIAAAGDTGGRDQPELYFEIRRNGRPVDPRPWFKQRNPG